MLDHINHHLARTCPACVETFNAQAADRRAAYDVTPVAADFEDLFLAIINA